MNVKIEAAVELVLEKMNVKLKDKQIKAVLSFMSRNDVSISLPTGYSPEKSAKSFFHNWQHSTHLTLQQLS